VFAALNVSLALWKSGMFRSYSACLPVCTLLMWKFLMFVTFSMRAIVSFGSWVVITMGGGLISLVAVGAFVRSSAVCLLGCPIGVRPPFGDDVGAGPPGLFAEACRLSGDGSLDDVVGLCLPILPLNESFFFYLL
jgi:hypothetical protein